jgi:hypothetical protein
LFLAIATRYSTRSSSRKSKISGVAKPPSSRTRSRVFANALRSFASSLRKIPRVPCEAWALPGRSTTPTTYCSRSSLKLRVTTTGR